MRTDFEATRARCDDRAINITRLGNKYGISKTTMNRFMAEKLDGQSGQGVYGLCEYALAFEGLLVLQAPRRKSPKTKSL